jgi:hypothetical protein
MRWRRDVIAAAIAGAAIVLLFLRPGGGPNFAGNRSSPPSIAGLRSR